MKWLLIILAVLCIFLQYEIWLSPSGVSQSVRLQEAISAQMKENSDQYKQNKLHAEKIGALKQNSNAMEALARENLGLVKPGEEYYRIVDVSSQKRPEGNQ